MATPVLLYLLKANLLLLLFAAAYFGLLRRLTFFTLNRAYLAFALLFSAVYPALPVPALLPAVAAVAGPAPEGPIATSVSVAYAAAVAAPAFDWAMAGLGLYAAGAAGGLGWLLVQLTALGRVRRSSRAATVNGLAVRTLPGAAQPFSFGQTIYLNPARHPAPELAAVLRHEQVHVRQWHTLDVLLAQLALALAWCNPAAWLLRRAVLDNLEFLADHAVLQTGLDRQAYQYSLLRLSHGAAGPALVSHFTFLTLKNRVVMMNTPLSSTGQLARYIVAGPLVLALALGLSAARAQGGGPVSAAPPAPAAGRPAQADAAVYYVDGQRATKALEKADLFDDVATMKILKGDQQRQALGTTTGAARAIVITTNKNRDRADVKAFNRQVDAAGALDTNLKIGPKVDPATHQLPAGIRSYLAATYPKAKLTSWAISDQASAKAPHVKYLAGITEGNAKQMLYFNAEEQPVTPAAKAAAELSLGTAARTELVAPAGTPAAAPAQGRLPIYYVDGQRQDNPAFPATLIPADIAKIDVIKGERAHELLGAEGGPGVVIVTTKTNQYRADVVVFNQKVGVGVMPVAAPAPRVAYLAGPALAYITAHYPGVRLLGVSEIPATGADGLRYQANLVLGRRPVYLLFDPQGQFISESLKSYER